MGAAAPWTLHKGAPGPRSPKKKRRPFGWRYNLSHTWGAAAPPDPPGTYCPTRPRSSASPDRNYILSRLSDCRSSVFEGNWRNISCDRNCDRSCDSNMRSDPLTRKPLCDQASLESVHLNAQEHTSYYINEVAHINPIFPAFSSFARVPSRQGNR